jgi:hypothetical protein
MPRAPGVTTAIVGQRWMQVLSIWVPGVIQYRIHELFPTAGNTRWRRFSAGPPWYWEGSLLPGEAGVFTFFLTDIYASLEIFKDGVPSSHHEFRVEHIFP